MQVAYCRDVVKVLHHSITARGLAQGVTMVGRAFTCTGTGVYLNALESVGPGEVLVQGGCDDVHAVWSPGWSQAYLAPRGAVGFVSDGGVCKSFQCADAAVPIFTKFVSPSFAINQRGTDTIGKPTVIGGHTVNPGNIRIRTHALWPTPIVSVLQQRSNL
jgi:regulator of RNase E activity RraA